MRTRSPVNLSLGFVIEGVLLFSVPNLYAEGELAHQSELQGEGFNIYTLIDISADASVIVGNGAFIWENGNITEIGFFDGGFSLATAVSADGNVVVGWSRRLDALQAAFRWEDGEIQSLGSLSGKYDSIALDVSRDGAVIVGSSGGEAFRWENGEMVGLGFLPNGRSSSATAVSADGSVVVGFAIDAFSRAEAVRWMDGEMVGLGFLPGGNYSFAEAANSDGSVVIGWGQTNERSREAIRWENGETIGLGFLPGGVSSAAHDVNADGSVVVGWSNTTIGGPPEAVRWDNGVIQSIENWLNDNGVQTSENINLVSAYTVSDDGSVVLVHGFNGDEQSTTSFITKVGGLISVPDIERSLDSTTQGINAMLRISDLIANGAHSDPLIHHVAKGERAFWVAGDWGKDDYNTRAGESGLAEISGGYNFGAVQINVSLGKTWNNLDLVQNGEIDGDGKYVIVEGIFPVSADNGLYGTLGGFFHRGEVVIRRGYLNTGLQDFSSASPDTHTRGVRARLDWNEAFSFKSVAFSPFMDLTYIDSHMDGYTEVGGGFPARFGSRSDEITEFRTGLNMAMPILKTSIELVGKLGYAYRFEREGARTSGEVLGVTDFDYGSVQYDGNWLRAGIGVEGVLGRGNFSLILNGTTQGEILRSWVSTSYQIDF